MAGRLSGGSGNGGSEDRERKIFYELDRADAVSFHVEGGGATATTCGGGYLSPSVEPLPLPLPPPPYDDLGSYSVMGPGDAEPYYIEHYRRHQQQQPVEHLSVSPRDACGHAVYGSGIASSHLPPASSDAPPQPSVDNVNNGYWYSPSDNDASRFSSKLLAPFIAESVFIK